MSDHRRPEISLTLRHQGQTSFSLELFPALLWPNAPGAASGLYRLRSDGSWVVSPDRKYHWYTLAGAFSWLGQRLGATAHQCAVRRGSSVTIPHKRFFYPLDPACRRVRTTVSSDPVLGVDGRWWTTCVGVYGLVAVDELMTTQEDAAS